jgi:hypothetical protein
MNLLKNLFKKKEEKIKSNEEFWNWFQQNASDFFNVVKQRGDIEGVFFDKLSPKLNELKDGFYFLTGMLNDNTADLILTADGTIKNIVFVEELVKSAPKIEGWKFTALKPASDIKNTIQMAGYQFSSENISFYANEDAIRPDEIDITVVHSDYDDHNGDAITRGVYIFIDNFLGELEFVTTIDNLKVTGKEGAEKELVPIAKLPAFLIWREKEFIEKYNDVHWDTENDGYSMLEAKLDSGNALLATINKNLLEWDGKASHPWIMNIEMGYDGKSNNGMPDDETYALLNEIEDEIMEELQGVDGYLNIGRQTAEGVREVYFACKDFRKPSLVLHKIELKYADEFKMSYDIYKDKYWRSFDRFIN